MGEGEMEMEVEICLPRLSHHLDFLQGRFLPLHFSSNSLPGCPLVEPESKDDGDEHQDDRLRGHLGVLAPALPPALHHLPEVGHHTLAPAGGLVGTHISYCKSPL